MENVKCLRHGIHQNQLTITKADKVNALVILRKNDYNNKVEEFISKNNSTKYYMISVIKYNKTYVTT